LEVDDHKPTLKAIILDFSSVNNVDVTSVQHLIDVRNQLDRYTSPEVVEWHFASINNRWTKRALAAAGFGYPSSAHEIGEAKRWKPIFSVAEIGGFSSPANAAEYEQNRDELKRSNTRDVETAHSHSSGDDVEVAKNNHHGHATSVPRKVAVVHGVNRPLFHIDLTSALQSAVHNSQDGHPHSSELEIEGLKKL
jgi:sodium-independent sulfate anion transporter 11